MISPQTRPPTAAEARLLKILCIGLALAALWIAGATWSVIRSPASKPDASLVVNDITQLNPIRVSQVLSPTTTEEIVDAVRNHPGPISIGGGRYSMGGQTATEGALQIDMRRFNRILAFDPDSKTITVQAGTTWRQIQEHIDLADLSVKIMQSYANFTVGGSLSVNAHGRYVGFGPIVLSVKSIKMVLPDGTLVHADRTVNPEIFLGAIGGYGGLGVITEATLELADNVRVKRQRRSLPIAAYKNYFFEEVRGSRDIIFHNANVYPGDYDTTDAISHVRTNEKVTVSDRLVPMNQSYPFERFCFWIVSEWPLGRTIRQHIVEPTVFSGEPVTWRNYEASYNVAELEPASRERSTYVLQEYFVPVERFDEFVPKMRNVLKQSGVNVINISIRHGMPDPGSLLAWARGEVFAFVLYYKQGTDLKASGAVSVWTRQLVDAALSVGGSYYLPYQLHATEEQFFRAYPRAGEFFALKKRLDPKNKFRNKLWDKYYVVR